MSKRDARKAIEVRLPNRLRLDLVASTKAHVPLSYLMRQMLRRAMATEATLGDPVQPGNARPVLVQLSEAERAALDAYSAKAGITRESALLTVVCAVLATEQG